MKEVSMRQVIDTLKEEIKKADNNNEKLDACIEALFNKAKDADDNEQEQISDKVVPYMQAYTKGLERLSNLRRGLYAILLAQGGDFNKINSFRPEDFC